MDSPRATRRTLCASAPDLSSPDEKATDDKSGEVSDEDATHYGDTYSEGNEDKKDEKQEKKDDKKKEKKEEKEDGKSKTKKKNQKEDESKEDSAEGEEEDDEAEEEEKGNSYFCSDYKNRWRILFAIYSPEKSLILFHDKNLLASNFFYLFCRAKNQGIHICFARSAKKLKKKKSFLFRGKTGWQVMIS